MKFTPAPLSFLENENLILPQKDKKEGQKETFNKGEKKLR